MYYSARSARGLQKIQHLRIVQKPPGTIGSSLKQRRRKVSCTAEHSRRKIGGYFKKVHTFAKQRTSADHVGVRGFCHPSRHFASGLEKPEDVPDDLLRKGDVGHGVPRQGEDLEAGKHQDQDHASQPQRGDQGGDHAAKVERCGDHPLLLHHRLELPQGAHKKARAAQAEDVPAKK